MIFGYVGICYKAPLACAGWRVTRLKKIELWERTNVI